MEWTGPNYFESAAEFDRPRPSVLCVWFGGQFRRAERRALPLATRCRAHFISFLQQPEQVVPQTQSEREPWLLAKPPLAASSRNSSKSGANGAVPSHPGGTQNNRRLLRAPRQAPPGGQCRSGRLPLLLPFLALAGAAPPRRHQPGARSRAPQPPPRRVQSARYPRSRLPLLLGFCPRAQRIPIFPSACSH